jgi:hypothetical protein
MRSRFLLVLALLPALAGPAGAGIIFKKSPKPTPAERVPELLNVVKGDGDESKRVAAAEELRQYDPGQFTEIVPTLVGVLSNDKRPAVRAEAAQTLGKLRPVSPQAGQSLEQALSKDPSMRVRLQARRALLDYHWHGYRPTKQEETPQPIQPRKPAQPQTGEPPLAPSAPTLAPAVPSPSPTAPPPATVETTEPPILVPAPAAPAPSPASPALPTPVAPAVPVAPRVSPPAVPVSPPPAAPVPQPPAGSGAGPRPLPQGPPAPPAGGPSAPAADGKVAPAKSAPQRAAPADAKGPDLGSED